MFAFLGEEGNTVGQLEMQKVPVKEKSS